MNASKQQAMCVELYFQADNLRQAERKLKAQAAMVGLAAKCLEEQAAQLKVSK
jgi:hypothetical protein